ncbi:hypothetical protein AVEN_100793-1 [Araneus ventricosus]|uniref:Uncharacterized protein n=1 Tax=Araneus ventricosus TaxID=182803 RepID=A0A4Y2AYF4_ARAVE|nr:hypothetical protein AVEN_100793-1 [Araneus ventricosus]
MIRDSVPLHNLSRHRSQPSRADHAICGHKQVTNQNRGSKPVVRAGPVGVYTKSKLIMSLTKVRIYSCRKKGECKPRPTLTTCGDLQNYLQAEKKRFSKAKRNYQRVKRDKALFRLVHAEKFEFYF